MRDINSLQARARTGDVRAEEELFQNLTVSFRLFVQHRIRDEEDAKEVVQNALKTIADKYRDTEFETSFAAWARKVLQHKILDYYKTEKVRQGKQRELTDTMGVFAGSNPESSLKSRLLDCLKKVNRVNPRHARILNLHYQGYSTGEICGKLDIVPNHLYVLLSRARTMLQLCLDGRGVE